MSPFSSTTGVGGDRKKPLRVPGMMARFHSTNAVTRNLPFRWAKVWTKM